MLRRRMAATAIALSVLVLLAIGGAPATAAPPATNDAFANAKIIAPGSLPYTDEVDSTTATTQPGEVASDCYSFNTLSIWYRITPTTTGYLRADTFGSGHESTLSIWQGTTLASIAEIACNKDATDDEDDARVAFRAVAGTRYYLRIDNSTALTVLHLRSVTPPANDAFANAKNASSLPFEHITSNLNATLQANEPDPLPSNCSRTGSTLWYRVVPSASGTIRADVLMAGIDTWIRAFRGTALNTLTPLVCNDDTGPEGSGSQSSVAFKVVAGTTYHVQVGGYGGQTGDLGVRIRSVTPPANDDFGAATIIQVDDGLHEVDTTRHATWQATEPTPAMGTCSTLPSFSSVWYRFTATSSGNRRFDTFGSNYQTNIAVYTGPNLGSLNEIGCDSSNHALIFNTSSGTTYHVQVSGGYGESGHLHVHLEGP